MADLWGGGGGGGQNPPQLWNLLQIGSNNVELLFFAICSCKQAQPPAFTNSLDPPLTSLQRTKRLKCWRFHCTGKELHGCMVYAYAVGNCYDIGMDALPCTEENNHALTIRSAYTNL